MSEKKKWIYGVRRNIDGSLFYKEKTTESDGYNKISLLGAKVIIRKKEYSNDNQCIYICF